ncbi:MAG: hypothetical protein IT245_04420 [Bacteroidia bacterium]|nr:hypothetical protein [Bacteroidia bacterium]
MALDFIQKFWNNLIGSDAENILNRARTLPSITSIPAEFIDATDDDDLEDLFFLHFDAIKKQENIDDHTIIFKLSEERKVVYLISEIWTYALGADCSEYLSYYFEIRHEVPSALKTIGANELAELFKELNHFIEVEYNGRLPFKIDFTEDFEETEEYYQFKKSLQPFDKAIDDLFENGDYDLNELMVEYIRLHKDKFQ